MELGIVLAVCIFVFAITIYLIKSHYKDSVYGLNNSIDNMEMNKMRSHLSYLKVLRREYALNILNSNEILGLDRKLDTYEKKVIRMNKQEFNIEISIFWSKYPLIEDFDSLSMQPHFAKYDDETYKLINYDDFDKKKIYLEIGKYIVLMSRFLLYGVEPTVERLNTGTDIKTLKKTQHRYNNQRLEELGVEAVRRRKEKGGSSWNSYEDDEYDMHPLDTPSPDWSTWIHIKNTDEYVVHEVFISDEGEQFNQLYLSNVRREILSSLDSY
jgi:hypothetical protein